MTNDKIYLRLMVPLCLALLLLNGGFATFVITWQQNSLKLANLERLSIAAIELKKHLKDQTRELAALGEVFISDPRLRDALKAQDRQRLLAGYEAIFMQLRRKYGITHFYFQRADRVNLLRVHQPQRHGDRIDRLSTLKAKRTGKMAAGTELGSLGTFTLRVVRPVFDGDTLIGYLELGKEIEDILTSIRHRYGIELAMTIRKSHLKQEDWEKGMRMLNRKADWNWLPNQALNYWSLPGFPPMYTHLIADARLIRHQPREIRFSGKTWYIMANPLKDVAGATVGELITMNDISAAKAAFRQRITIGTGLLSVLLIALFAFLHFLLRRTDRSICRQQAQLLANEAQLAATLYSIGEGVIGTDRQSRVIQFNQAAEKLTGWRGDEALGQSVSEFVRLRHASTFESLEIPLLQVVRENTIITQDTLLVARDGTERRIMGNYAPIHDNGGQVTGIVIALRDVTREFQLHRELQDKEVRFHRLYEASADAIVILDDENFTAGNPAALLMFGIAAEKTLRTLHPVDLSPPRQADGNDSKTAAIERIQAAMNGKSALFEWDCIRHDTGAPFTVEILLAAIEQDGKTVLQATARDITKRKQVEEQVKKNMRELERINRLMSGREMRMLSLKKEVNALLKELGRESKYRSVDH
ncbi:MAG: PAS domain S-box protein [Gammaproteobacteria bacterium]|nr:PAS domain S-box protein [Gammaproteobacteria bacterium]